MIKKPICLIEINPDDNDIEAPPSEANIPQSIINPTDHPNLILFLNKFLEYTSSLFDYVSPRFSTQSNESLHYLKSKFANKYIKWTSSFEARMSLSVLHKNKPYVYYYDLLKKFNFELNDDSISVINKYAIIAAKKAKLLDLNYRKHIIQKRYKLKHKKYSSSVNDHRSRVQEISKNDKQINKIVRKFQPIPKLIRQVMCEQESPNKSVKTTKNVEKNEFNQSDSESDEDITNYLSDDYSDDINYYSDDDSENYNDREFNEEFYLSNLVTTFPKPNSEINAGLVNCGNSCFINAVIQFLFSIPCIETILERKKENVSSIAQKMIDLFIDLKNSKVSYNSSCFVNLYKFIF